jgi:hypothetical protein
MNGIGDVIELHLLAKALEEKLSINKKRTTKIREHFLEAIIFLMLIMNLTTYSRHTYL